MNIWLALRRIFVIAQEEDKREFSDGIARQNLARVKPVAILTLIFELCVLLRALFLLPTVEDGALTYAYIALYAVMMLLMTLTLVLLRIHRIDPNSGGWAAWVAPLGAFLALLWAAAVSLLDMAGVYRQSTVLIAMQYLIMVIFIMPPALSLAAMLSVQALFIAGIHWFFPDPPAYNHVLINTAINTLLVWVVSYMMYRGSYQQYRANRMVKEKNEQLSRLNAELAELSVTDPLTLIMNRRHFDVVIAQEWRRAQRENQRLTIAIADVDHFKQYNDLYGHQAGDECLCRVVNAMNAELRRASDTLARFGGEEFIILMCGDDGEKDESTISRVRAAVELLELPHEGSPVLPVVTVSIGGCNFIPDPDNSIERMIRVADEALYEAKASGRNKVVFRNIDA